jgi:ATP-dependent NAD(P)H-hydrate dehydratase
MATVTPIFHAARAAGLIPSLLSSAARRKGEHGKILICGGSAEYTGAPFYAGSAALLAGADLCWVVCAPAAAPPLKTLSPELIVLGAIPESPEAAPDALSSLSPVLSRIHALVVGPGLGRSPGALAFAAALMAHSTARQLPLVVDGDGLFLLSQQPHLLRGHRACVLTPNAGEWERLTGLDLGPGLCVLKKGGADRVEFTGAGAGAPTAEVAGGGMPRRCGGQGDVLAGSVGCFLAWAAAGGHLGREGREGALAAAACGGALLVRAAAAAAFAGARRATLAPDILRALGGAFEAQWPAAEGGAP